ncbi:MAG: putative mycofactocin radical SAM maturase MftC [Syntrophomonadaceae bacterium]|nr:putative mycofactocin radical SAM maturase MftC [Bacillota bacterium]MBT9147715.1 putative mycofactocin radical SAM maturase MftC [Bacillota bacterium]
MKQFDEERMRISLNDEGIIQALRRHSRIISAPEHVALDITNRCNMRCLHCFNRSGTTAYRGEELSDDEVLTLAREVRDMDIPSFCFCGGEPLLRFDLIEELLPILCSNRITLSSMVTNGYLLDLEKARMLSRAGLWQIQVSLDGAQATTHEKLRGLEGSFDRAVQAIENAKKAGFPKVAIAFSPTKFNCHEFWKVVEIVEKLGVPHVRVQPLMLLGRAVPNREDIFPSQKQYMELVRSINELRKSYPKLIIEWGDPVDHLIRFSTLLSEFVPYVDIKSDGSVGVSSYLPLYIGNIRRHSLGEYWEAGLGRVWSLSFIKKIAGYMVSGADFYRPDLPIPLVFYDTPVHLDLIDDRLFEINSEELHQLYRERALERAQKEE